MSFNRNLDEGLDGTPTRAKGRQTYLSTVARGWHGLLRNGCSVYIAESKTHKLLYDCDGSVELLNNLGSRKLQFHLLDPEQDEIVDDPLIGKTIIVKGKVPGRDLESNRDTSDADEHRRNSVFTVSSR